MASYLILIIFGSLLCYIMYTEKKKQNKFAGNSRVVQGIIVDHETVREKNSVTRYPVVRFTTENGDTITKKSADGFSFTSLKKGMKATVIYNVLDPAEFIVLQPKFKSLYVTVMLGGIIFILTGLVLLLNDAGIIHLLKK